MNVLWFPRALDDLEEIRAYIARDDPGSAAVVVQRLLDAVETLRDFPESGRHGHVAGTRELVVTRTPYIVTYRTRGDFIHVLNVLHGARYRPAE